MEGSSKLFRFILSAQILLLFTVENYAAGALSIDAKSFLTHTHISIPLNLDQPYSIERVEHKGVLTGIRLIVQNGARSNFSQDGSGLISFNDDRTASIKKSLVGSDLVITVMFSDKALKQGIDYFDYRDRSKSDLYLDYWFLSKPRFEGRAEQSARAVATDKVVVSARDTIKHLNDTKHNKVENSTKYLSREKHIVHNQQGLETHKQKEWCLGSLSSTDDQVVHYRVYHNNVDFISQIESFVGDRSYNYIKIKSGVREDNKPDAAAHYNVALKLYKNKKYGLALRAMDLYQKEFKDPRIDHEVNFMRAAALDALGTELKSDRIKAEALEHYIKVAKEDSNAERQRRARMYILHQALLSKDGARIYSTALEYARDMQKERPMLIFMAAEYAYQLGDNEKALEHYYDLIKMGVEPYSVEAQYRIGEAKMRLGDFEKALLDYKVALKKYPNSLKQVSYAVFNMAECLFRLEKFNESKEMFKEFRVRFPQDKMLWAAELKIPEIDRMIINASHKPSKDVRKRYSHVINRHPYSLGAFIAHVRLSQCVSVDQATEVNFYKAFFNKKNTDYLGIELINPIELKLLTELNQIRFYNRINESALVLPFIAEYRDRVETMQLGAAFKREFVTAVNSLINTLDKNKKFSDVRTVHEQFSDYAGQPAPINYLLSVARAYENSRDIDQVQKILSEIKSRYALMDRSQKDLFHRLSYYNKRLLGKKDEELEADLLEISEQGLESSYKYSVLAKIYFDRQEYRKSLDYDLKQINTDAAASTIPVKVSSIIRALQSHLKLNMYSDATKLADVSLLRYGHETKYHQKLNEIRKLRIEALYRNRDYEKTIQAIDEIYDLTPKDFQNNEIRAQFEFMRAKALYGLNRKVEAQEAYRKIANMGKTIWAQSAKAELELAELNRDHEDRSKAKTITQ